MNGDLVKAVIHHSAFMRGLSSCCRFQFVDFLTDSAREAFGFSGRSTSGAKGVANLGIGQLAENACKPARVFDRHVFQRAAHFAAVMQFDLSA